MRTEQPTPRQTRAASPWWPRRDPWRQQAPVPSGLPPAAREDQLPPGPPPSPPMLNRIAGTVLLAGTLGAVSVLGFATAVWGVVSPFVRMFQGTIQ